MPKKNTHSMQSMPLDKAVLALLSQHRDKGLLFKDILHLLPRKDINRKSLRIVLQELTAARRIRMVSKHYILHHRIGKTRARQSGEEYIGTVVMGKGQALLFLCEELERSARIFPEHQHHAIPGDTVKASVFRRRGQERFQAKVIRVHKREGRTCLMRVKNNQLEVRFPSPLPLELVGPAPADSEWYRGEILPEVHPRKIQVRWIEENHELRDLDLVDVIDQYDIPDTFPEAALQQSKDEEKRDPGTRVDLRSIETFTIDGADARDYDDAISIRPLDSGFELYVHIADVSHFVRHKTPLDNEAIKRATSVYFPAHVVPMLPENISNHLCSLVPDADRQALSLKMDVSRGGRVRKAWLCAATIHSNARFTYDQVRDILEEKSEHPLKSTLKVGHKLFKALNKRRVKEGSIDFDLPETQITLDDKAHPIGLERTERHDAHRMIEEFMLLANETIARFFQDSKVQGVFRHHPIPKKDDARSLIELMKSLGVRFALKDADHPKAWQEVIESLGPKHKAYLQPLILRTMQQAHYRTDDSTHFGLAKEFYSHFTSPIRRYPDLLVHRQLHRVLELETTEQPMQIFPLGKRYQKKIKVQAPEDLNHLCLISSRRERRAIDAERDYTQRKKTLYAIRHIGESYMARVTGLNTNGLFLEIKSFPIEGMLSFTSMPGHWIQQKELYQAFRRRPQKAIRIGDELKIKITAADPKKGRIDFEPAEEF